MVDSVRNSVGDYSYEIIIVDGGSTDGSIAWCKSQEDIRIIEQGELLGAIPAFNEGAYAAEGDVVALLNDDIVVLGSTLKIAYEYLLHNPQVGQVAFENEVVGKADKFRTRLGKAYGYLYGQCSMTPKWLGDVAGWWGKEGMRTYGGDARLSLRLWELGYSTVSVTGCAIRDYVADDDLRRINAEGYRGPGKGHPDTDKFQRHWRGRLPKPEQLVPVSMNPAYEKAKRGVLRTLRFKGMMSPSDEMRRGLWDELKKCGPTKQVNQSALMQKLGKAKSQKEVIRLVSEYKPDMIMFQIQRDNNVTPATLHEIRRRFPHIFLVNWDGDTHYPMLQFHADVAKAVHLQLTISPDLFEWYTGRGVEQIGYWPIAIEKDYMVPRADKVDGPDVLFTGALYGHDVFPCAQLREDAVVALENSDVDFKLYGRGWEKVGIRCGTTNEKHALNAQLMSRTKMTLSISQTDELWGYTSDRLYNITATGCPALVHRFSGMEEHGYVDGETCIAWSTVDEMMEKVKYYLNHEGEREMIGRAGQVMTWNRHTWEHRMFGFWQMAGDIRW